MLVALGLVLAGSARLATRPAGQVALPSVLGDATAPAVDEPPPPIEPLELQALPRETAVAINAAIPMVAGTPPAASPFRFPGDAPSLARATACLAAAAWYEAGDDEVGQRSVMQVVLNRVRHPAYPRSVCAVVFQGSERATGCQFTFTCDGALRRQPSEAAWTRATRRAAAMLNGSVDRSVGWATHYHTDWVVPYWSSTLDKIARVRTHLFFRWRGGWGTGAAFRQRPMAVEPAVSRIAWLSAAHQPTPAEAAALTNVPDPSLAPAAAPLPGELAADAAGPLAQTAAVAPGPALVPAASRELRVTGQSTNGAVVLVEVPPGSLPGDHALGALRICRGRNRCTVVGWPQGVMRPAADDTAAIARSRPVFVFLQDDRQRRQDSLWDCRRIARPSAEQCLPAKADVLASLIGRQPVGAPPSAPVGRTATPASAPRSPAATPRSPTSTSTSQAKTGRSDPSPVAAPGPAGP